MRSSSLCRILMFALTAFMSDVVVAQSPIGHCDAQTHVGSVRSPGTASHDPQLQSYLVTGSGQNMWNDRDDFHFVWKRMTGNFILSTRARFIGAGVAPHPTIGSHRRAA